MSQGKESLCLQPAHLQSAPQPRSCLILAHPRSATLWPRDPAELRGLALLPCGHPLKSSHTPGFSRIQKTRLPSETLSTTGCVETSLKPTLMEKHLDEWVLIMSEHHYVNWMSVCPQICVQSWGQGSGHTADQLPLPALL